MNGTLSRDADNIALQQRIWAAQFRLYPMIGYGGNITGLHPLWENPEPFIEAVVADAVRYSWAGIVSACLLVLDAGCYRSQGVNDAAAARRILTSSRRRPWTTRTLAPTRRLPTVMTDRMLLETDLSCSPRRRHDLTRKRRAQRWRSRSSWTGSGRGCTQ